MNIIFIDNISFFSFFKILLKNYNSKEVKILSEEKKFSFIWIKLLGFFNFKVNYEKFFFGDIILKNNESIYLNSRKEASEKSFLYSKWILRNSDFLINKKISLEKKKILELYISKTVFMEMEHFIRRFEYLNYKYYNIKKKIILLPSPNLIEKKFIKQNFSNCHVFFYGFNINYIYNYLKLFIKNLIGLFNYCCSTKVINNKKSIVSIATDSIDLDSDLRHFPNWYTPSIKKLFIINFNHHKVKMSNDELLKNSIQLINNNKIIFSVFKKYHFKIHNNEEIPLSLLLEIKNFFYMTNGLFFLLKNLKCNRFIYSDPQDPITDSVQLFSSDLGIKTICLQYTNMAMKVPLLIPSSDIFLSFSNIYKKVFKWNDLGPKKIIPIGYAFKLKIIDNQFKIKENLRQRGVKIIITYFDESVQNEKWGLLNEDQNSRNMEIFARLVINNPKISVILKPQFCFNTIYKYNSVIVKKALLTNRFLELNEGSHRNIITPGKVAQISDYCICSLTGATAALECALYKKRVLLINPHGFIGEFNYIYNKANLIFPSIESAINSILKNKNKDLGNWETILNLLSQEKVDFKKSINNFLIK